MAVKFRRDSLAAAEPPHNRYEMRPGQSGQPARRRLLYIYVVVVVLAGASIVVHFLTKNQLNRWLPERPGEAVVVEKLAPEGDGPAAYRLRVRVAVPAASPQEAGYLPEDFPERDEALRARELEDDVVTPEADWQSVETGTRLRASYQLNIPRTKIMIRALYLDHLGSAPE